MTKSIPLPPLSDEALSVQTGVYKHYKGHCYQLLAIGRHSETLEECVIYEAIDGDPKVWVRPLKLFRDNVTVENKPLPRFEFIKKASAKKRPQVGVGIAVVHHGKVLLGKRRGSHGSGHWTFPGGHLEHGETIEECVQRELSEETGLQALTIKQGPWTNDIIESDKHYATLFVFVPQFTGSLELKEPNKCECWQWFAWDQLPSPLFLPIQSLIEQLGMEQLKKI